MTYLFSSMFSLTEILSVDERQKNNGVIKRRTEGYLLSTQKSNTRMYEVSSLLLGNYILLINLKQ